MVGSNRPSRNVRPRMSYWPGRRSKFRKHKYIATKRSVTTTRPLRNNERSVVPSIMQTTFPYTTKLTHTVPIGLVSDNTYRGNSIYDPDLTGTGTRANGNYEWSSLYDRYKVISSRITVTFSAANGLTGPAECYIIPNRDSSPLTASIATVRNYPNSVRCILTGGETKSLVLYCRTATMYGTRTADDVGFAAGFTANPTAIFYYHVVTVGDSQNDVIQTVVNIEYFTVMYNPNLTYPVNI